jgi:hypothetical protein
MVARTAARRSRRKHTATKGEPRDVKYRLTDEANELQLCLFKLKGELNPKHGTRMSSNSNSGQSKGGFSTPTQNKTSRLAEGTPEGSNVANRVGGLLW